MKNYFNRVVFFAAVFVSMTLFIAGSVNAEGLLNRNSGQPSDLQKQELDDAYYRGYNDAKSGKEPIVYNSGGVQNKGEALRGAGRGALGGAAIGNLSDGDVGKAAAWGAGAGAVKGVAKRRRAAQEEDSWASQLNNAYNSGYRAGMSAK
jgi:hypothetical protein